MIRSKDPEGVVYYFSPEEDEELQQVLQTIGDGSRKTVDLARLTALFTDSRGGWDKDHDQDAKCANPHCGHSYERHFDTYADMEPVGCKYCGHRCSRFVEPRPKR